MDIRLHTKFALRAALVTMICLFPATVSLSAVTIPQDSSSVSIASELWPDSAFPQTTQPLSSEIIHRRVFETLCDKDEGVGFIPVLAKDWKVDSKKGTVSFSLNSEAKFSDGLAISAKDVVASFAVVFRDGVFGGIRRYKWRSLLSAQALGSQDVVFNLSPTGFVESEALATICEIPVLPAAAIDTALALDPTLFRKVRKQKVIGSGLWTIDSWGDHSIVLRPNQKYWRAQAKGHVTPARQSKFVRADPTTRDAKKRPHGVRVLILNTSSPQLADAETRKALSLLVEPCLWISAKNPAREKVSPLFTKLVHTGDTAACGSSARLHSKEATKQLLLAGWQRKAGATVLARGTTTLALTALIAKEANEQTRLGIQEFAKRASEVGVDINVVTLPWRLIVAEKILFRDFHLLVATLDGWHPEALLASSMQPGIGNNFGGYVNRVVDDLALAIRRETDTKAIEKLEAQIMQELAKDLPIIPLSERGSDQPHETQVKQ